jgi:HPt (histidine-containing phosphotransfer) domain-containing protein
MDGKPSVEERLAALGTAFRDRLAVDAERLRALAAELETVAPAELGRVVSSIRAVAHRLAGTAPAFQAADLGDRARDLEVEALSTDGAHTDLAALKTRLHALLALLEEATGARGEPRTFTPRI